MIIKGKSPYTFKGSTVECKGTTWVRVDVFDELLAQVAAFTEQQVRLEKSVRDLQMMLNERDLTVARYKDALKKARAAIRRKKGKKTTKIVGKKVKNGR